MNKKGFTLVEILAVIVLLSIIITIVATKGFGAFDNTKKKIEEMNEEAIVEAVELLAVDIEYCDDDVNKDLLDNSLELFGTKFDNCDDLVASYNASNATSKININYSKLIELEYLTGSSIKELEEKGVYNIDFYKNNNKVVINAEFIEQTEPPVIRDEITFYVDTLNGNDSNYGSSIDDAFYTIEKAIEASGTSQYLVIKINNDLNLNKSDLTLFNNVLPNENSKISFESADGKEYKIIYNILYTGQKESIEVSPGEYLLEVWGAQGGYRSDFFKGGMGGYSYGTIKLNNITQLFVYVGGLSKCNGTICTGGFNGGGYRYKYKGGGGGTDIRIGTDSLYSRVIVAGGGGSDGAVNKAGMYGGGTLGGSSGETYSSCFYYCGKGGTQTYSGYSRDYTISIQPTLGLNASNKEYYAGGFGFGGGGIYLNNGYGGAGGGGWYGGSGTAPDNSSDDDRGGGGGSGFVYTSSTASSYPSGCLLNSDYYLTNAETIAGNEKFLDPYGDETTGNWGDGYARISYIVK